MPSWGVIPSPKPVQQPLPAPAPIQGPPNAVAPPPYGFGPVPTPQEKAAQDLAQQAIDLLAQLQAAQGPAADPTGRYNEYGVDTSRHPANAAYVSDDGLVSYDINGNRLDRLGNIAFGDYGGSRGSGSGAGAGANPLNSAAGGTAGPATPWAVPGLSDIWSEILARMPDAAPVVYPNPYQPQATEQQAASPAASALSDQMTDLSLAPPLATGGGGGRPAIYYPTGPARAYGGNWAVGGGGSNGGNSVDNAWMNSMAAPPYGPQGPNNPAPPPPTAPNPEAPVETSPPVGQLPALPGSPGTTPTTPALPNPTTPATPTGPAVNLPGMPGYNPLQPPNWVMPDYNQNPYGNLTDAQFQRMMAASANIWFPYMNYMQGADQFNRTLAEQIANNQWSRGFQERTFNTEFGEGTRRYNQDFAENARRYGLDFGEAQRRFNQELSQRQQEANWQRITDAFNATGRAVLPRARYMANR